MGKLNDDGNEVAGDEVAGGDSKSDTTSKMATTEAPRGAKGRKTHVGLIFHWLLLRNYAYLGDYAQSIILWSFLPDLWMHALAFPFPDSVRDANDDPTYVDEIKERIRAGKKPPKSFYALYTPAIVYTTVAISVLRTFYSMKDTPYYFEDRYSSPEFMSVVVLSTITGAIFSWIFMNQRRTYISLPACLASGIVCGAVLLLQAPYLQRGDGTDDDVTSTTPEIWESEAHEEFDKSLRKMSLAPLLFTAIVTFGMVGSFMRKYKKTPKRLINLNFFSATLVYVLLWSSWYAPSLYNEGLEGTLKQNRIYSVIFRGKSTLMYHRELYGTFARNSYGLPLLNDLIYESKGEDFVKFYQDFYVEIQTPNENQEMSPYLARKLLGLGMDATPKAIKQAHRQMSREWHPDKYQGKDLEKAEALQIDMNVAKKVLDEYPNKVQDAVVMGGVYYIVYSELRMNVLAQIEAYLALVGVNVKLAPKVSKASSVKKAKKKKPFTDKECKLVQKKYDVLYKEGIMNLGGPELTCEDAKKNRLTINEIYETATN